MKRLIYILAVLACVSSCVWQTEPSVFRAELSSDTLNATETAITVKVTCDMAWSVSLEDDSWAAVEGLKGTKAKDTNGEFTVKLGFNSSTNQRKNAVILKSGSTKLRKEFTQTGLAELLAPNHLTLADLPQTLTFNSAMMWAVTIPNDCKWMQCTPTSGPGGGDVVLTVEATEDFVDVGSRSGSFTIIFDGRHKVTVPVTQLQKDAILLFDSEVAAPALGCSFSVDLGYNVDFVVDVPVSWVHHIETKTLNQATAGFLVDVNPDFGEREAVITFRSRSGGVSNSFIVRQEGKDPLIAKRSPGLYKTDGDFVYEPFKWQTSRISNPDGSYDLSLLDTENMRACTFNGLPSGPLSQGETVNITYSVVNPGALTDEKTVECVFLEEDETLRWFRGADGTGIIVKR